jgi:hypothetical protein
VPCPRTPGGTFAVRCAGAPRKRGSGRCLAKMPEAVTRGSDGYLRVFYDKLGVKFQAYEQWIAAGARIPSGPPVR